ncbi:hypothetical protein PRUPE_4G043700 [Prunus persica]|uniref:Uncharacterized protein n=1 Tax=Prunus persica TaxID=3760 RepID=A0A251PFM6_PRUPE|nr:hypothetical protein PRUPE_4G043700 [Prunus persica]
MMVVPDMICKINFQIVIVRLIKIHLSFHQLKGKKRGGSLKAALTQFVPTILSLGERLRYNSLTATNQ